MLSHEELLQILRPAGISWSHIAWEMKPPMPYGVYLEQGESPFFADDRNYAAFQAYRLEIYSSVWDPRLGEAVANALTEAGICYEQDQDYLAEERLYETIFEIEV